MDELIAKNLSSSQVLSGPKFLSKKKRSRLAALEPKKQVTTSQTPTRTKRVLELEEEAVTVGLTSKRSVKKNDKRFNFGWELEDDTSSDYQPLVTTEDEEKSDLLGKHWTDKKLDEMTSRDWRIFKEDYNISARGSDLEMPLRSWGESKFHQKY